MNDREKYAKELFGRISYKYDRINDRQSLRRHRSWKRFVTDAVYEHGAASVLDLCTGTGDVALLVSQLPTVKNVVGADYCPEMLSVAKSRSLYPEDDDSDSPKIRFLECDAASLPFEDDKFDCVTVSFGLREAASPPDIIRQAYRVLKPGGLLVCLDSCRPMDDAARIAYTLRYKFLLPLVSGRLRGEYAWLREQGKGFYNIEELGLLFEQLGFRGIRHREFEMGLTVMYRAVK